MSNIGSPYNYNAIMQKALLLAAEEDLVKEIPVAAIIVDSNSKEIISFFWRDINFIKYKFW